jgi:hypothetical protein
MSGRRDDGQWLLMAANARQLCAAPHQSAVVMAKPCKGRHQMECGEQWGMGLGGQASDRTAISGVACSQP